LRSAASIDGIKLPTTYANKQDGQKDYRILTAVAPVRETRAPRLSADYNTCDEVVTG
jgi:hypothetical protein